MRKRNQFSALLMAMAVAVTAVPVNVMAESGDDREVAEDMTVSTTDKSGKLDMSEYTLKWQDEFDGETLNRDDWNVELHEPGWVNAELQEYVDSKENIQLKDGKLYLNPIQKVSGSKVLNHLQNADFSNALTNWEETIANWGPEWSADASSKVEDGTIIYDIKNAGEDEWHIQLKQTLGLKAGKKYQVSYKISSTAARKVISGVQDAADYTQFGQKTTQLEAGKEVQESYTFTLSEDNEDSQFYFSLGKMKNEDGNFVETPASTIRISDIVLAELDSEDKLVETVKYEYTSGRISTQNKHDFTYGVFEARAKVPEGKGYLPAFWLMSTDETVYGQWPRCGEIDCMEVMGDNTQKLHGTIHYGSDTSHSQNQGTYELTGDDSFSKEFHTFTCEWKPGEINWFVDGNLYYTTNDWYSSTTGQGTLTYPAPFDQPFYVILNLAVGGSWVGYPDDETFEAQPYIVDYVRVYQKDSYDEDVKKPEKVLDLKKPDADGNYITNGKFEKEEDLTDDADWKFLTALEGEASAKIENNTMKIETVNDGTVDYSVQLVQAKIPLEKGATYRVSFDAKADEARTMNVAVKAPDRGYAAYMTQNTELTTEYQPYTYEFKMADDTDANARLEYNMGATGSKASIYLQNVKIEKIKEADPNEKEVKTVRKDGNYIYNGKFQEGDKHLGEWNFKNQEAANISVTDWADGRRLKVEMKDSAKSVTLSQSDLTFPAGTDYVLSFDAEADKANTLKVVLGGNTYSFDIEKGGKKNYSVKIPHTASFKSKDIEIVFGTEGTTYIDNIMLQEDALLKNGSFVAGMTNYEQYVDGSASAEIGVDSLKENNALDVNVKDTGDQDWKVQVKQNNIPLKKGATYELTFKAKSSLDRKIRVIMQGLEDKGWQVYSSDNTVTLTSEFQTFTDTFVMNYDTDEKAFLSICLGKVDEQITNPHRIIIDDITLREVSGNTETDADKVTVKTPSIKAITNHSKGVKIAWNKISDADGYVVYRKNGAKWEALKKITKNTTVSYIDKKAVKNGQNYQYKVVAYKKADGDIIKSKASAKKSIYFVAVPSGVGVKGATESLRVSWKKVSGVTSYAVEYATDSKFATKETVSVKDAKTVSKVIKNLSAKKKYYVRVCAKKTIDGKTYRSAWSSPKKGTTK